MSAEFRRKSIVAALFCISLVFAIGAWSGSGGEKKPASPYDDEEYKEILAQQVGNIYQLEAWAAAVQDDFLPILPPVPEFILKQPAGPEVLPFDAKSFPPAFVNGMAGIYENSVPVYPVLVVEDPATRALTFYNLDNEAVYTLPPPAGYDPFAFLRNRWPGLFTGGANEAARRNMMQLYDPARIQVRARLIESDNLAHWIYAKRQIETAEPLQPKGGDMELKMMLGDAPNSNIFFTVVKRATNYVNMTIQYPSGFTNGLDIFTCNDLMAEIWSFGVKNLATTGTNATWIDTNAWVVSGYPLRLYAAADATTDGDGDGYADGREIMVYGTDPTSSNSHPVTVSGTVSYSGIETGGVYVLFTQDTDSWSIAKSLWQASPGAYTNDEIANGQSWWFKAFRDANGNFALDPWEARGVYSNSATYVSGSLTNVDIAMADVPSIWGQISYSGSATGDIHVLAVTGSNSWDETYSLTIPYVAGTDTNGGEYYVTFPVSYALTGLPASNYWIRAYMDTDTNGTVSLLDPAGQYSSNSIPVSNRTTGINVTMAYDSDADGMADWWEMQYFGTIHAQSSADDPDNDGLSNAEELAIGSNPGYSNAISSVSVESANVTIQTRRLASTHTVSAEGEAGFYADGTYYQHVVRTINVSGLFTNCSNIIVTYDSDGEITRNWADDGTCGTWTETGDLSYTCQQEWLGGPSSGQVAVTQRYWVWTNTIGNVAGTNLTLYYSSAGTLTNTVTNSVALTNFLNGLPISLGYMAPTGSHTDAIGDCQINPFMWTDDLSDPQSVLDDISEWDNEHAVSVLILDDAPNYAHVVKSTPITLDSLLAKASNEVVTSGAWSNLNWNGDVGWIHACPGPRDECANWVATTATNDDWVTSGAGEYRAIRTGTSDTGIVYRLTLEQWFRPQGATTSVMVSATNYLAVGTGSDVYWPQSGGYTAAPPAEAGCLTLASDFLKLAETTDTDYARSGQNFEVPLTSDSSSNVTWSIAPAGTAGMASLVEAASKMAATVHVGTVQGIYTVTVQHATIPFLVDRYVLNVREFQRDVNQSGDEQTREPINLVSRAVVDSGTDLSVATPGIPLVLSRQYNSRANLNHSGLGLGWSHGYDLQLQTFTGMVYRGYTADVWTVLSHGTGQQIWFPHRWTAGGSCTAPFAPGYTLSGTNVLAPAGWTYGFLANGLLGSIGAPGGIRATLTYTNVANQTRLAQINHHLNASTTSVTAYLTFLYDEEGRLAAARTPVYEYYASYAYTADGCLQEVTIYDDGEEAHTSYTYTDRVLDSRTSRMGETFSYGYQAESENADQVLKAATSMTGPAGAFDHTVTYPAAGISAVTYSRDGQSLTTTNVTDAALREPLQVILPGGVETVSNSYDASHNATSIVVQGAGAALSSATTFDGNNHPTSFRSSYGSGTGAVALMTWDATLHVPTASTDADGIQSVMNWTADGLLSSVSISGVVLWGAGYVNGLPVAITNAAGHTVTMDYSESGLVTGVTSAAGIWLRFSRDDLGTVTSARRRDGTGTERVTSFDVNNRGWVNSITYPDAYTEQFRYNAAGRATQVVDRAGRTSKLEYTVAGRLTGAARLTSNGWVGISHSYDQQLNLLTVKDELSRPVETYTLDGLDRITNVVNLASQSMSVAYSVGSHVARVVRYDGSVLTNAYDGGGRLASTKYLPAGGSPQAGETNVFTWTGAGRLLTAEGVGGAVSNRYDSLGRLASEDQRIQQATGLTRTVSWLYDPAGNVTNTQVSSVGLTNTFVYDADGRVVTARVSNVRFDLSYNPYSGLPYSTRFMVDGYEQFYTTQTFDSMGRLAETLTYGAGFAYNYAYGFNAIGLITNRINAWTGETNVYAYDELDRLASVTWTPAGASTSITSVFQYDLTGNRTNTIIGTNATAWTYGAPNQLTSFGANTAVKYDSSGNVTTIQYSASQTNDLVWNARHELVEVRTNGVVAERYGYDALGRRTTIIAAGITNALIYDGVQVVAEYTNGVLARTYLWGPGIDNLLALTTYGATTNTYAAIKDHLGSVKALVDTAGNVTESYQYDAWGRVTTYNSAGTVIATSALGNRYLFTGREYSYRTGLYHYRARSYDPTTARFLSADPIGISGGHNLYEFCNNNPVNFADPDGTMTATAAWPLFGGEAAAGSGIAGGAAVGLGAASGVAAAGWLGWEIGSLIRDPLIGLGERLGDAIGDLIMPMEEHISNKRPSTKEQHEKGRERLKKDDRGEKGDARRDPRTRKRDGKGRWYWPKGVIPSSYIPFNYDHDDCSEGSSPSAVIYSLEP